MKTFSFINKSCYRRQGEIRMVRSFLNINGWEECSDTKTADLIIFFTCAFCQSKVKDAVREIVHIKSEMKSMAELIVGSCLPKTDKESLEEVFDGKTIDPTDFSALDSLPHIKVSIRDVPSMYGKEAVYLPERHCTFTAENKVPLRTLIPKAMSCFKTYGCFSTLKKFMLRSNLFRKQKDIFLSAGCLRKCSYCAIRFATGQLRSKPLEGIMQEFIEGLRLRYRKFGLYADSIGDYGLDIGTNLGELFDRLLQLQQKRFSIGIYDLHPSSFIKYFDKIVSLCEIRRIHYLYVPVQSGNERILRLMNRPCNVSDLKEKLLETKRFRKTYLQTSVIVGFPGETEEEFEDTLNFLRDVDFDNAHIHCYTDMPKTKSSKLAGKIDKDTMLGRLSKIISAGIKHDVGQAKHEWEDISM